MKVINSNEEWRTVVVKGEIYENYQVSNLGNVKSLNYNHTGKERILKPRKNKGNYLMAVLCKDGKRKNYYVHRLVAETFLTKIPGKEFVDHINGIRNDNRIDNLRWCTHQENSNFELCKKHQSENNVWKGKSGKLHHRSKAVLCIENGKMYGSTYEVERELGINHASISQCCLGKVQSAGKHPVTGEKLHWKYVN